MTLTRARPRGLVLPGPRRWIVLVLAGVAINVAWEFGQAGLYGGRPPWWVYLEAAVTDGLIIAFAALFAALWRRAFWPVFLVALLATAAFIELRALAQGRWSYAESMPTVFTIGLSPLVQLALTGTLAVLIAWRAGGRAPRR
jgi:hypothetical protein